MSGEMGETSGESLTGRERAHTLRQSRSSRLSRGTTHLTMAFVAEGSLTGPLVFLSDATGCELLLKYLLARHEYR